MVVFTFCCVNGRSVWAGELEFFCVGKEVRLAVSRAEEENTRRSIKTEHEQSRRSVLFKNSVKAGLATEPKEETGV
jgi:hypothetical protein